LRAHRLGHSPRGVGRSSCVHRERPGQRCDNVHVEPVIYDGSGGGRGVDVDGDAPGAVRVALPDGGVPGRPARAVAIGWAAVGWRNLDRYAAQSVAEIAG